MSKIKLAGIILALVLTAIAFMADSCDSQANQSQQGAQTACQKWGCNPNITNYYEYLQLKQIYELRDDPKLILNAYLMANDGTLICFGQVKGFGIPYGTQFSPPNIGSSPVPEPNALYPSSNTQADWVQYIDPNTGKATPGFIEPNMVITEVKLPCMPMKGQPGA